VRDVRRSCVARFKQTLVLSAATSPYWRRPPIGSSMIFMTNLEARGVKLTKIPTSTANGLRGTVVAVKIDPKTAERHIVETPGVLVFSGSE
jgi:hypothetical protein